MGRLCNHCARCKKPLPRVCTGCGLEKPDVDFPQAHARGRTYLRTRCRECCNAYYRARYYSKIRREQIKLFKDKAS